MTSVTGKLDFGGDYKNWKWTMRCILDAKGLWEYGVALGKRLPDEYSKDQERSLEAALLIFGEVETRLLLRVPAKDRLCANSLLDHLGRLTQPFRLLDLPPELRVRIFELHFSETTAKGLYEVLGAFDTPGHAIALPPLTRVSRQLRAESLPAFMATTSLTLVLKDCGNEDIASAINGTIRAWAEQSAKAYLRHLRTVKVDIYASVDCVLSFTAQEGLKVTIDDTEFYGTGHTSPEDQREKLQEYIKKIEAERRVLDLKGESIVLALIRDPNVWIWEGIEGGW